MGTLTRLVLRKIWEVPSILTSNISNLITWRKERAKFQLIMTSLRLLSPALIWKLSGTRRHCNEKPTRLILTMLWLHVSFPVDQKFRVLELRKKDGKNPPQVTRRPVHLSLQMSAKLLRTSKLQNFHKSWQLRSQQIRWNSRGISGGCHQTLKSPGSHDWISIMFLFWTSKLMNEYFFHQYQISSPSWAETCHEAT